MLLKPYSIIDKGDSNPFNNVHIGIVVDNNDPEKRKRIKVQIDPWYYLPTEKLPWVKQDGNGSVGNSPDETIHSVPEVGADVSVYFKNGDPDDPVYKGVETTEANKCSLFDEDYPHTHGEKDSIGNFTMHNKKTGISLWHHNSGTEVQYDPDGSFTITNPTGAYAHCDSTGNWTFWGASMKFNIDGEFNVNATTINMTATKSATLKGDTTKVIGSQSTVLGGGNSASVGCGSSKIDFNGSAIDAKGNFQCTNGASGVLNDIMGARVYVFNNGILTSTMASIFQ